MTPVIERMRFLIVIIALGACTDWDHTQPARRVCVSPVGNGAEFRAGEPIELGFSLQLDLGGCPSDFAMYCDATVMFDTIYVSASIAYNDPVPTMCPRTVPPRETCASAPLAAGTYTIVFEQYQRELEIPSTRETAPCLDEWLEAY